MQKTTEQWTGDSEKPFVSEEDLMWQLQLAEYDDHRAENAVEDVRKENRRTAFDEMERRVRDRRDVEDNSSNRRYSGFGQDGYGDEAFGFWNGGFKSGYGTDTKGKFFCLFYVFYLLCMIRK